MSPTFRKISYFYPRISALFFVFMMFLLVPDLLAMFASYPIVLNLFTGIITLIAVMLTWNRHDKKVGLIFILIGILYFVLMWDKMIWATVLFTSTWLVLTGVLFFFDKSKRTNSTDPKDSTKSQG